jgi:5'-nucleotidase
VIGTAPDTIHLTANFAGESPFGDLVADSQLEAARASRQDVVAVFQNPGGIRTDLIADPQGPAGKRPIAYSSAFAALPFGNRLAIMKVTGEIIRQALEAQFAMVPIRMLQVSKGFTYAYDRRRPAGGRVDPKSIRVNGRALDLHGSYWIAINSFLAQGGDEFVQFVQGTDRTDAGSDLDALIAYVRKHSPVAPDRQTRIVRLDAPPPPVRQ